MKNGFHEAMDAIPLPNEDVIKQVIMKCNRSNDKKRFHTNVFVFVISQAFYLKSGLWIAQVSCVMVGFILSYMCMKAQIYMLSRFLLSLIPILIHMLSMPLLFKSMDNKTTEIENTTYYRYSHVLLARIMIIGLCNLFLITTLIFFTVGLTALTLEQTILYAVVPFNLSIVISFTIMLCLRNDQNIFHCVTSNAVLSLILFVLSNTTLYMDSAYLFFWRLLLIGSVLLVAFILYELLQQANTRDNMLYQRRNLLWN